jgi:hypothetical protein
MSFETEIKINLLDNNDNACNQLNLLCEYTQQNIYFTGNPNYSLFDKHSKFKDTRKNDNVHHRHTHFVTSHYPLNPYSCYNMSGI